MPKRTAIHNARISAAVKKAWREKRTHGPTGYKHTEEAKKKISEYVKENPIPRPPGYHQKERHPQWGKPKSDGFREFRKNFMIKWWADHKSTGKFINKADLVGRLESLLDTKDTTYMDHKDYDIYLPQDEIVITIYQMRNEVTKTDSRNKFVQARNDGMDHISIFPDNIEEMLEKI
jgi:hypothetical protein